MSPRGVKGGNPFRPGVLAVEDPMAGVDLAREVICSPVLVGTCLQWHWREWMEGGAGEWVVKTLRYGKDQPFSVSGTKFSRGQSSYGVSLGLSGFLGEAGPRWPITLSVPSVVPEETLEGSVGPTLVGRLNSQVMNLSLISPFLLLRSTLATRKGTGPVRAIREYLCRTRDCHPRCSHLFVTVTEPRRVVHPYSISHWICQVIQRAHENVSKKDKCLVRVKAHEVRAVVTSALFKNIWSFLLFFGQEPRTLCPHLHIFISGIFLISIWTSFLWVPVLSALRVIQ
ncbi:hypothetical protein E2C01_054005 [Portunus trituberculatus]|uniref:Uncharacterized protein n=1 Tax=Portunus trituberculatus TaxID=210409 RepID=A0A5B7GIQ3_PORTR|nr:hypothetical protein [Portunus trituberculatus]